MFKILNVEQAGDLNIYTVYFETKLNQKIEQKIQIGSPEKDDVNLLLNLFSSYLDAHNGGEGMMNVYRLKKYDFVELPIDVELE